MSFPHPKLVISECGDLYGKTIADLGAGHGAYLPYLAELAGPLGTIYAVEVRKEEIPILSGHREKLVSNIHPIWGTIDEHGGSKIIDGGVQVALLINVLFLLDDPRPALHEALRILEPGGRLVIVDWHTPLTTTHRMSLLPPAALEEELHLRGAEKIRRFAPGPYHFGLLYSKRSRTN